MNLEAQTWVGPNRKPNQENKASPVEHRQELYGPVTKKKMNTEFLFEFPLYLYPLSYSTIYHFEAVTKILLPMFTKVKHKIILFFFSLSLTSQLQ